MLLPDPSIDVGKLTSLVESEFARLDEPLRFVPVGADSWSYRSGAWWVSLRRDRGGHAPQSYEAAAELRERGHEYVLAPVRARSGRVVIELDGRPIVVTRFVEGRTQFPDGLADADRSALVAAVERLHGARLGTDVPRESFELQFAPELARALERADRGCNDVGPLGADVGDLLRRNRSRIDGWRDEIGRLQDSCRGEPPAFVLTHGEPAPPNVMVTRDGRLLLLDWGDLRHAPPERDARALAEVGVTAGGRADVERFYELRWILSEVAEYAARLTSPHPGSVEDLEKRQELSRYLS